MIRRIVVAALAGLALAARGASAQTLTTGALSGTVTAREGGPVGGARVVLRNDASGFLRSDTTDGAGRFAFTALPIGHYAIRVEQLGYRPLLIPSVPVEAASRRIVSLALLPEQPPVTRVDTAPDLSAATASGAHATWSRWQDVEELGDRLHLLPALAVVSAAAPRGLELEGLPSRWSGVAVDGSVFDLRPSPLADRPDLEAIAFPLWSFDGAELNGLRADGEWPAYGGGLLRGFPAGSPHAVQPRAYAMGGNEGYDAAAIVGAPLVQDTAGIVVGVLASRRNPQLDAPWRSDSAALAAQAVANDSFATDLGGYLRPYRETTDLVSGFARLDWQLARGYSLGIWAGGGDLRVSNLAMGRSEPVGLDASLHAREVAGTAVLTARLSSRLTMDGRLGIQSGTWDYGGSALAGTAIAADGLAGGTGGTMPGHFRRSGVQGSSTLYLRAGSSLLKGGFFLDVKSYDDELDELRAGSYAFGDVTQLARGIGSYSQVVGALAAANFHVKHYGFVLEDEWRPTPTLGVSAAVRTERELYPTGEAALQADWLRLTGIDNSVLRNPPTWRLSPRFAMRWTGADRQWALRADAALVREQRDPGVFDEWIGYDGGARMRRGLGALGAWPGAPDSSAAPVQGPILAVVSPELGSPRTGRVSVGIDKALGGGTALHLSGSYRHTDFLTRRTDLNLRPQAAVFDQDGRPVYGQLVQEGGLVAPSPGSNRRFAGFDMVSGLEPTGYSDYWGVSVALDRLAERGINLRASYTYSQTTDNVPGLAGGPLARQLSPFPEGSGAADWRDGRSDLDVPHRAVLAMEWRSGGVVGLRLGVLVRYESGYPFTPGFRDGVDANGDGSGQNDPAFVTDTLPGAADVVGRYGCLRASVGRFASRNACRGPAITSVDARFAVRLFNANGMPVELIVDGLNLVRTDEGLVDRALYLVDPAGSLGTAQAGRVNVPLVINPNFGRLLVRRSAPAAVRAGLRFNF